MSDDTIQNFKPEDAGKVFIFAEDRIYELEDGGLERSAPATTWFPHPDLALLWQIYSRCFSSLIQDRQYGHR